MSPEQAGARAGAPLPDAVFRTLFDHVAVGRALETLDGRFLQVNAALCQLLGYTADELLAGDWRAVTATADDLARDEAATVDLLATPGRVYSTDKQYRRKDGTILWGHLTLSVQRDATGTPQYLLAVIEDATARVQAEEALRTSEARFRALSEHATDLVAILGPEGTYRYLSPSWQRVLGYAPADVLGRSGFDLIHPEDMASLQAALVPLQQEPGGLATAVFRMRHADGSWRTVEASATNRLDDPAVQGLLINARDITARVQAEEALRHQALHDGLTGLPNRTLLRDRLEQALRATQRDTVPLALFLLDLDRFKEVNDTLGHDAGDALLQEVSRRVLRVLRAVDTVARLGGDEFAVALPQTEEGGALHVAQSLLAVVGEPIVLAEQRVTIGVSIGVALAPQHGQDATTLLRHADVAMYAAKHGGGGVALYVPTQDQHSPRRLALLSALRQALSHNELRLHYQPLVDLGRGVVTGVEALVRWQHPERGLLLPEHFVPLAEQSGLITALTRWVLDQALRDCRQWQEQGHDLSVAVNLSMANVHEESLPDTISALLAAHGVPAERLQVELTETALMRDPAQATRVLRRLAALGVRIAIDDFGTGYSSLSYLRRLPLTAIKLNRSFVTGMGQEAADATIVASTIGLGHSLGLSFVAEGVEDAASWQQLAALGCDAVQGYYCSRPLPADALGRWLATDPS